MLSDQSVRIFKSNLQKRILIVDDEPYNLLALKTIIKAADTTGLLSDLVDAAVNGSDALTKVKKAHQFEYALIFMDCSMPIMDGYEATMEIRNYLRANVRQQPMIVACTGHSEPEYIKKAWRNQMDELVAKPANV